MAISNVLYEGADGKTKPLTQSHFHTCQLKLHELTKIKKDAQSHCIASLRSLISITRKKRALKFIKPVFIEPIFIGIVFSYS